jgi:uncharacterized phiE125 gp8 family phage protein
MPLKLITPPAVEPIGLEEIQNFLRIDSEPDVTILTDMIITARKQAEIITGRQLITATWELRLDRFAEILELPRPPLQSVSSVKYLDEAGTEQTFTDYLVDDYSEPARVLPAYGYTWPVAQAVPNAVRIVFICGYGDADTDVPEPIRNWMKTFIGSLYENRETVFIGNTGQGVNTLAFLDGLLDDYRVYCFG